MKSQVSNTLIRKAKVYSQQNGPGCCQKNKIKRTRCRLSEAATRSLESLLNDKNFVTMRYNQ